MVKRWIIRNTKIFQGDTWQESDILIEDGKFSEIGETSASRLEEFDAMGRQLWPGQIDSHVHFNEPGRTDWEGFETGTFASILGGVTSVFDMPLNSSPPTLSSEEFHQKAKIAAEKSYCDFGLYGGVVSGNLDKLEELCEAGVIAYKAFMCNSGANDFPPVDEDTLFKAMEIIGQMDGRVLAIHAEDDRLIKRLTGSIRNKGGHDIPAYLNSRPVEAEYRAIALVIAMQRVTGCPLHIVHVSHPRCVGLIQSAKLEGLPITCETCPHYLLLNTEDLWRIGAPAKCAPPLRAPEVAEELKQLLGNGWLDTIGSDHSPSTLDLKQSADFFEIWGGIASVGLTLPLLYRLIKDKYLSTGILQSLLSGNPSKIFGISTTKGTIAIGQDADFFLFEPASERKISDSDLNFRHKISPFIGYHFTGQVNDVFLRGQHIVKDGKIVASPSGRLLRPD